LDGGKNSFRILDRGRRGGGRGEGDGEKPINVLYLTFRPQYHNLKERFGTMTYGFQKDPNMSKWRDLFAEMYEIGDSNLN